jgi:hypothetical protein
MTEADVRNDFETDLTRAESRDLRCIAGVMIPPSAQFGVPGADDAIIFADIVASLGRDLGDIRKALGDFPNSPAAGSSTWTRRGGSRWRPRSARAVGPGRRRSRG